MHENLNNSTIMIVDDIPENLMLLSSIIKDKGYKIKALSNGTMAISSALRNPPDIILLDIMMPDIDGYEVCKILKKDDRFENIPIIFISALSDPFDKVKAFDIGGVDYITKPFNNNEVNARIKTHLSIKKLQEKLNTQNAQLKIIVDKQVKELTSGQLSIITAMTKLAEIRDDDTGKHIERTQTFCKVLSEELRKKEKYKNIIDDEFIHNIYNASPLHDIGKVAIPDNILLKPGRLTPDEFEIMKTHAEMGKNYLNNAYLLSSNNSFLKMGVNISGNHHEKWDGSGYPLGLKGEDIPICARIMAIADVYDALRSKRVYKDAFSHEKSVNIMSDGRSKHFDPYILDTFLDIHYEFNLIRESMGD